MAKNYIFIHPNFQSHVLLLSAKEKDFSGVFGNDGSTFSQKYSMFFSALGDFIDLPTILIIWHNFILV